MPRHKLLKSIALAGLNLALLVAPAAQAQNASQRLRFEGRGWHFVSLQIQPTRPHPADVFRESTDFKYDHIWSYDPADGWRHFSPDRVDLPRADLNDLLEIEPLRGYWILVVSDGPAEVPVEGTRAAVQDLPMAGWHAVGPLLDPQAAAVNVATAFADMDAAVADVLQEVWSYDYGEKRFSRITDFDRVCASSDDPRCLRPGQAYWIKTNGRVLSGRAASVSTDCIVLSAEDPLARLDVSYLGLQEATLCLTAEEDGSGLRFHPARQLQIDGSPFLEPDFDLDRANTCVAGDDPCNGASDCASFCSRSGEGASPVAEVEQSAFVSIDPVALGAASTFSTCDEPYTRLRLSDCSGARGAAQATPVEAYVNVAVRPAILRGEYAGSLFYDGSLLGDVPFRVLIDDCVTAPGSEECASGTGRAVGVINPTIQGSNSNGIDDDGFGELDVDEEREIPVRDSPSFPPDMRLLGTVSADGQFLRLQGGFSAECEDNVCRGSSRPCRQHADCGSPDLAFARAGGADTGIAGVFANAGRELVLHGVRSGPATFSGSFSDRYGGTSLGPDVSGLVYEGTFVLSRARAPECVARDPGANARSVPLGISCRSDSDCPGRCEGDDKIRGLECTEDSDCQLTVRSLDGSSRNVSGTCNGSAFRCGFRSLAGVSESALEHADALLEINGIEDLATVELLGPETITTVASAADNRLSFGWLPCGLYLVRVSAPLETGGDCVETVSFNPCVGPPPVVRLTCPFQQPVPRTSCDAGREANCPTMTGGTYRMSGGVVLGGNHQVAGSLVLSGAPRLAAAELTLLNAAGQSALVGRSIQPGSQFTDVFSNAFRAPGPAAPQVVAAGVLRTTIRR